MCIKYHFSILLLFSLLLLSCASPQRSPASLRHAEDACTGTQLKFGESTPDAEQMNVQKLRQMTDWINQNHIPVLSLLISKNGQVVYALYTSSVVPDQGHYLMSVTKSVLSALVGIAVDDGLISSTAAPLSSLLPRSWFVTQQDFDRFKTVNLKQVMAMSALDTHIAPQDRSPEGVQAGREFFGSKNRVKFALTQPLVASPGEDYLYTDVTPILASGAVQIATGTSLYDFANEHLFRPMHFKNQEWMHQDAEGVDNGAFGLRLRPIDMQKFGLLYLNSGCFEGKRLLSKRWVQTSFTPWMRAGSAPEPNYGWYWHVDPFPKIGAALVANGWKGQQIAVFPEQNVVLTLTGVNEQGSEKAIFEKLVNEFLIPALYTPLPAGTSLSSEKLKLAHGLKEAFQSNYLLQTTETRMIPSVEHKETRIPFQAP